MKKILVIEDDPDVRTNLIEILELEEFDVAAAGDGEDGSPPDQDILRRGG